MNGDQLERIHSGKGFIAALDQSGGSTPKALEAYGIGKDAYSSEEQMFDLVHQMRSRIIKSASFTSTHILGAILFERTMNSRIDGMFTADFLWNVKGIVPFLKIDKGLAESRDGVQEMKPIPELPALLDQAEERNVFGTKMRSLIREPSASGIGRVVDQQFELCMKIVDHGLVPIIEPEVDIHAADKARCEEILLRAIEAGLAGLPESTRVMFKISIPEKPNLYSGLMRNRRVVRVVALSGGYGREEATRRLAENRGLIASFSRALAEGLFVGQSEEEFDAALAGSVESIFAASVS